MFRRIIQAPILLLCCFFLTGCIVQSFFPFYAPGQAQALDGLQGEWSLVEDVGEKVDAAKPRTWNIKENILTAVDKDNRIAAFELTVFTVDGQLYADIFPSSENKLNEYLAFHFSPVHTLCKLVKEDRKFTFIPLDPDWLQGKVETHAAKLSVIKEAQSGMMLYTSSTKDWQHFLKAFGRDPKAFNVKNQVVLARAP